MAPPIIVMQKDYYGKPFRIVVQNISGVWIVKDTQTAVIIPVQVTNNNTLEFIIGTETASNVSVATNNSSVTVVLQDWDLTTNMPVGSQFTVGFTNNLSSQVYVTQTHFVYVKVVIVTQNDVVTFYLS